MRIPSGVTDQYIYFVAVDSTDLKTRETGLSSFTVYRSRNNGTATAMTTPTVAEIDATNMPGVYTLLLNEDTTIDAGDDSQEMVFHITATGMAPVTRTVEIYRPKVTAGETINTSSGSVDNVTTVATTTTNTDMRGTDNAFLAANAPTNFSDLAITASTGRVTVGTNNDKTGYSISGSKTTLDALNDVAATDIVSSGAITTSAGAVSNVTLVATTTTNTDMRGTDGANTTTPPTTADIWSAATRTLTAGTNLNDLSTTDILGMTYESTEDFQDFLRLVRAVLVGKTTGAGTGTENFRDAGDSKNRVISTIDSNGDRTNITTDTSD